MPAGGVGAGKGGGEGVQNAGPQEEANRTRRSAGVRVFLWVDGRARLCVCVCSVLFVVAQGGDRTLGRLLDVVEVDAHTLRTHTHAHHPNTQTSNLDKATADGPEALFRVGAATEEIQRPEPRQGWVMNAHEH